MSARRHRPRLFMVPGNSRHPEVTLAWLVMKGWFKRDEEGVFGPAKPPTSRATLEAFTMAVSMVARSDRVIRMESQPGGQIRFKVRK